MKASDVFTPGKFPTVTFVDTHITDKSIHLKDALEAGGAVVSLSGPSKSGKTVFVEQLVGRDNLIHVTGAGVESTDLLWKRVFDILGTPLTTSLAETASSSTTVSLSTTGGLSIPIVKAEGAVGTTNGTSDQHATNKTFSHDYLQLLIRELKGTEYVLFIDDFHYINHSAQIELARQIKEAIRNDLRIICASVPYHADDVIRANDDLRGRVVTIDLSYWTQVVLSQIGNKGFSHLNINCPHELIVKMAAESAGSPQLMQSLCLNAAREFGITETQPKVITPKIDSSTLTNICTRTVSTADYRSIVNKMSDGPKTRGSERKEYVMTDGTKKDVYPVVLKAIAKDPPTLNFRYNNLYDRVTTMCYGEAPSGSSVIGACTHMTKIANDAAARQIIEWDQNSDVLDIRDPYLLFFLRWGDL